LNKFQQHLLDQLFDKSTPRHREMLRKQLETQIRDIKEFTRTSHRNLANNRRALHVKITEGVEYEMKDGYQAARNAPGWYPNHSVSCRKLICSPGGHGHFAAMKEAMDNHISSRGENLYRPISNGTTLLVTDHWDAQQTKMTKMLSRAVKSMKNNYGNKLPDAKSSEASARFRKGIM
jgi:hypothetical protein